MNLRRRTLAQAAALLALPAAWPAARAERARDSLVLGMVLEPAPGLDPTSAPAAAIGEVVHYNVLEGLTRITSGGAVLPLLAAATPSSCAAACASRMARPATPRR
jgi:peptide/nickel transport system substrate-binding protein